MVRPAEFNTFDEMENSNWLADIRLIMANDQWPKECVRCEKSEAVGEKSIREYSLDEWKSTTGRADYLQVGGVLDNVCNAACQTCNEYHSTYIGSKKKVPIRVDNGAKVRELPWDRITHLDLNGGEPSYSKNYKELIRNPPPNLKHLRLNTNCSTVLYELGALADRDVDITVTVSLDGIGPVHEYMRWPISWSVFLQNLTSYRNMPIKLNAWTTVSALNIGDFNNIVALSKDQGLDHAWAFLEDPSVLSVTYSNSFTIQARPTLPESVAQFVAIKENNQQTLDAYIREQDTMRGINIQDFIK